MCQPHKVGVAHLKEETMIKSTQKDKIKTHLERYEKITLPQMMKMGISQHGARIYELRREGMIIVNVLTWDSKKKVTKSVYFSQSM